MDKIIEIINNNPDLISDINNHPSLINNLLGILKNIEKNIPENCRQNFYKNLGLLRIVPSVQSMCSLESPVICIDEKLLSLADNNRVNEEVNFTDILVESLYHELLHLFSTSYVVDLEISNVSGFSGFVFDFKDLDQSNNLLNGLTEGFTQYLTLINNNSNFANYDIQIECVRKLIDIVGIDTVKESYFNNKLGMQPIINKLLEKGLDANYIYDLEERCHIDSITHLSGSSINSVENKTM